MQNLTGGSGDNSFQIQPQGYLTGTIEGGVESTRSTTRCTARPSGTT